MAQQQLCEYCRDLPLLNGPPVGRITRCPICRALVLLGRGGVCHLLEKRPAKRGGHGIYLAGFGGIAAICLLVLGFFYLRPWQMPVVEDEFALLNAVEQVVEPGEAVQKSSAKNVNGLNPHGLQAKPAADLFASADPKPGERELVLQGKTPPTRIVQALFQGNASNSFLKEIARAPEAALYEAGKDHSARVDARNRMHGLAAHLSRNGLHTYLKKDGNGLANLPFLFEKDCKLVPDEAKHFEQYAQLVHLIKQRSQAKLEPLNKQVQREWADSFWTTWNACVDGNQANEARGQDGVDVKKTLEMARANKVPILQQMIEPECPPFRMGLVQQLATIETVDATRALVKRALFDVDRDVRWSALEALECRLPVWNDEIRRLLLFGLDYPLMSVNEHAAQAIVQLRLHGLAYALIDRLDTAAPGEPVAKAEQGRENFSVRECVKINHLRNCMLCHPVSSNFADPLRGMVPDPTRPLPEPTPEAPGGYNGGPDGTFVCADTTFLRQDFSVTLPVANAEPWPKQQRFDFVVRTRTLNKQEAEKLLRRQEAQRADYRHIIHMALRELTGHDAGLDAARWRELCAAPGR
ncbi:MAG: HEAT repeat domain-containing protein [Gemmataceae bacterium]|nr:HEAT repeat domain-containing protein [Gemmataceae bacterium]MCI0740773.1 HEAT repeat domain-containing protein [Gemmataceae bacterium]